jgi:NSS family neurotransmitter:Na+ symporter
MFGGNSGGITMDNTSGGREEWKSRLGFIMAAVGSAVGLGNIWRFPYMTAESGGAGFLVLYLALLLIIGIPVMIAEFIIGRKSRLSPVQALSTGSDSDWKPLGILFVITGFVILSYYSVVAGWTLQYMVDSVGGVVTQYSPGTYFNAISEGQRAIFYHLLFMSITTGIVLAGVQGGIEKSVKFLIPTLVILLFGLAIWVFFQDGSAEGYKYYLQPNLNRMFTDSFPFVDINLLANAAGQTFFTLSLGMGAMITYSSYLSQKDDLVQETLIISLSNVGIAFLAGLIVFPVISAFDIFVLEPGKIPQGTISTLFKAIPKAFQSIGGFWGSFFSFLFFGCLFLAALTSGISLLEVVTSSLMDEFNLSRRIAATFSSTAIILLGIPSALDLSWLGMADQIANNILLLSGGFFITLYVGWTMSDAVDELKQGLEFPVADLWLTLIRYVVPLVMLAVLLLSFWEVSSGMLESALDTVTG